MGKRKRRVFVPRKRPTLSAKAPKATVLKRQKDEARSIRHAKLSEKKQLRFGGRGGTAVPPTAVPPVLTVEFWSRSGETHTHGSLAWTRCKLLRAAMQYVREKTALLRKMRFDHNPDEVLQVVGQAIAVVTGESKDAEITEADIDSLAENTSARLDACQFFSNIMNLSRADGSRLLAHGALHQVDVDEFVDTLKSCRLEFEQGVLSEEDSDYRPRK